MKKIKLNNVHIPDKKSPLIKDHQYQIFTGTSRMYFKNKKKLKRHLHGLNVQLNHILLELNNLYINIFIEYRKIAVIYNEYFNRDCSCNELVILIEKYFIKATTPTSQANRNYFYVFNLTRLTEFLIEFCNLLIDVQFSKKHNSECNSLRSLLYRLENIRKELESFGKENFEEKENEE